MQTHPTTARLELLVDNKAVSTNHYFELRDPGKRSSLVAMVANGTAFHADQAVRAAHKAYLAWRDVPVARRIELILDAAQAMEAEASGLAETLVREQGMLLADTRRDVSNGVETLREIAAIAEDFLKPEQHEDHESLIQIHKAPRGVVAAIVPWNAPMGLTMAKVAPALVSGNTIVVKPSPFAPLAVSRALELIARFLPDGVVNVVHGDGEIGPALTRHPLVRKISFTGGIETGKAVMAAAAESVKNVGLELGGNDPAIVLDDAAPEEIVPHLIKRIFVRSGQVCYAVKRIYVPQSMYESFFDTLCEAVDRLQVGYGLDPRSTLSPVNNHNQFRHIRGLIEGARRDGAHVLELGGRLAPETWEEGYYLRPAVIGKVAPDAPVVVGEQFGPIIPVVPYRSEDEALRMANGTEHGLGSSIWTRDADRGQALARRIEAGLTFINSHARTRLGDRHIPFGGVKQSGIGRVRTRIGLAEYIEYHTVSLDKRTLGANHKKEDHHATQPR